MNNYLKDELYRLNRENDAILSFIQDTVTDGIWYWDLENPDNEWMNPKFWTTLGYDPEKMPHSSSAWQDIINKDDLKTVIENFKKHLENPEHPYDQIVRYTHANGSIKWIRCKGVIIRDKNDKPVRMLGLHYDITEQMNSEQELLNRETTLRAIFSTANLGIAFTNTEGKYVFSNHWWSACLGYSRSEILNLTNLDVTHPLDKEESNIWFDKLINGEVEKYLTEKRFVRKDGSIFWGELAVSGIKDKNNKISLVVGLISDITERKNVEKSLRESEERYIEAQRLGKVGHWYYDIPGDVLSWSDQVYEIYGVDKCTFELNFNNVTTRFHSEDKNRVLDTYQNGLTKKEPFNIEHRIITPTGIVKYVLQRGFTKCNEKDEPILSVGTISDISDQKKNERIIHSRLELVEYSHNHSLNEVLQKTLDLICELTESPIGFYHFVDEMEENLSLQAWSTRTQKEFCKAEGKGMHYPISQAGVWVDCVKEKKPVIHNEYETLPNKKGLPPGHARVIRELVVPILKDEKTVAILGVGNKPEYYDHTDIDLVEYFADMAWEIAERKKTSEQIAKQNEQLKLLNATKDKFISILAHDLKNPIGAIMGLSQIIAEETDKYDQDQIKKLSGIIYQSTKNTFALLNDLLTWGRNQQDKIPFNPEHLLLKKEIMDCISLIDTNAKAKEISVSLNVADELIVSADREMIKTVVRNLLTNGIKFTPRGGTISIDAKQTDNYAEICIVDNGIGMKQEEGENLFKITNTLSGKGTEGEPGTGFGLILCNDFITKHGSKIIVESKPGEGSCFKFQLPLA